MLQPTWRNRGPAFGALGAALAGRARAYEAPSSVCGSKAR